MLYINQKQLQRREKQSEKNIEPAKRRMKIHHIRVAKKSCDFYFFVLVFRFSHDLFFFAFC